MDCSWTWRRWSWIKIYQISQTPHLSRVISHGILPSKTLNRPKFSLLKSRAMVLLFALLPHLRIHHLIVTTAKAAPGLCLPSQSCRAFLLIACSTTCIRILPWTSSRNLLRCLCARLYCLFSRYWGGQSLPWELGPGDFLQLSESLTSFFPIRGSQLKILFTSY